MAFFVPRDALKKRHQLQLRIASSARVVRAADLATWLEAQDALAFARSQAEDIVAEARQHLEAERRRGYAEGLEQAKREAARHMAEQVTRANTYLEGLEASLVDLVMQATRRLVENFDDRERAAQAVRNALKLVRNQKSMTARVHPASVSYVQGRIGELLEGYPGVELLDVVGDSRLEPDACVLESEIGIVEASTEGQLDALRSALHALLPSNDGAASEGEAE